MAVKIHSLLSNTQLPVKPNSRVKHNLVPHSKVRTSLTIPVSTEFCHTSAHFFTVWLTWCLSFLHILCSLPSVMEGTAGTWMLPSTTFPSSGEGERLFFFFLVEEKGSWNPKRRSRRRRFKTIFDSQCAQVFSAPATHLCWCAVSLQRGCLGCQ